MTPERTQKDTKLTHPIRRQIVADTKALGTTQVLVPLGMAAATFIVNWWRGEVVSVPSAAAWLGISVLLGFLVYFVAAVVRAPFVVIGQYGKRITELEGGISRLQDTLHSTPDIIVMVRECFVVPKKESAECFLFITLTNSTDVPSANPQEYVLTLSISGKEYQTKWLLNLNEYYLSWYTDIEVYGEVLYDEVQEVHWEEKETQRDSLKDIRSKYEELKKGHPVIGWIGFTISGLPAWPYHEEVTGVHMEWTFGEDHEPIEEVPVENVERTTLIHTLERVTITVIDWYNKAHTGHTSGPFDQAGKRIVRRPMRTERRLLDL